MIAGLALPFDLPQNMYRKPFMSAVVRVVRGAQRHGQRLIGRMPPTVKEGHDQTF
jgi:hypothetical protein